MDPLLARTAGAIRTLSAETSAVYRSKLAAFIEREMTRRPESWACVQSLQRACVLEMLATPEGAIHAGTMFAEALTSPLASGATARIQY